MAWALWAGLAQNSIAAVSVDCYTFHILENYE